MWVFTKYGFFSVVCARQGDGKKSRPVDTDRVMVRARRKGHLEALLVRFPQQLGGCDIRSDTGTDYAYRLFVAKATWAAVLSELAAETDYDNFKSEVSRHQGSAATAYEDALHEVWAVMHRMQVR